MFIRKNVIKLAIPIMIEQTFVMLLGVFNTMMAGHIGEEAVSAVGMVDSINNIFISVFAALSVGATVVVAQQIGKRDNEKVNETIKQALVSGVILSFTITILILWFSRRIGKIKCKIIHRVYIIYVSIYCDTTNSKWYFKRVWRCKETYVCDYVYEYSKCNIRIYTYIWY